MSVATRDAACTVWRWRSWRRFIIDARVSARSPRPRPRVSILAAGSRNDTLAAKLQKFSTQRGDSPEALFSVLGDVYTSYTIGLGRVVASAFKIVFLVKVAY